MYSTTRNEEDVRIWQNPNLLLSIEVEKCVSLKSAFESAFWELKMVDSTHTHTQTHTRPIR